MSTTMSEYFAFDINLLIKNPEHPVDFDIFVRLSDNKHVLIIKKGDTPDVERLNKFIQKSLTQLFVKNDEQEGFQHFVKKITKPAATAQNQSLLLNLQQPTVASIVNAFKKEQVQTLNADLRVIEQKIQSVGGGEKIKVIQTKVEDITKACVDDIFVNANVNTEDVNNAINMIKEYVTHILVSPNEISSLLSHIDENHYFHYHAVSVSILTIFITRIVQPVNDRLHKIAGMGAFLHDIGKTGTKEHDLNPILNPEVVDTDAYYKHPEKGFELLSKMPDVPEEVKIIVLQHHERPDGEGFPNKVSNLKLYYPSKVVAIANNFSKLVAKEPFGIGMAPKAAIEKMNQQPNFFDKKTMAVLKEFFNVKS